MGRTPGTIGWLAVGIAAAAACFPDPDKLRTGGVNPTGTGGAAGGTGGGADGSTDGTGDGAGSGGAGGTGGMGGTGGTGGGGTGGTGGSTQTKAEACAAYADATATALNRCSAGMLQVLYGSLAMAQQRLRLLCRYAELAGANYPKRPVEPCLAALGTLACNDFFDDRVPVVCDAAGDYPATTRCTSGDQCQSYFCDLSMPSGVCGTCQNLPGAGQPCYQGSFCQRRLLCSDTGTCAVPGELNTACDEDRPCRGTLVCNGGLCLRKGVVGDLCSSRGDCDEPGGAICNPNTARCAAYRVGTTCGVGGDAVVTICPSSGFCNQGSCTPAAADGATCDDNTGPLCLSPARCVEGTCQLPVYQPSCVRTASAALQGRATAAPGGDGGRAFDPARYLGQLLGRARPGERGGGRR
jgi:hypothetical protein